MTYVKRLAINYSVNFCTSLLIGVACTCSRRVLFTWSSTIVVWSVTARCCVRSMNERKTTTDSSTWSTPHRRPSDDCSSAELTTVQRVTGQNMQWRRQDLARAWAPKRHGNSLRRAHEVTHKIRTGIHRVTKRRPFHWFSKMRNQLILITAVPKILKIFDIKHCCRTLYSSKVKCKM